MLLLSTVLGLLCSTCSSHVGFPSLNISTESVFRLMSLLGYDEIDTVHDSLDPGTIACIEFENVAFPVPNLKGAAFFYFDNGDKDTAFSWLYAGTKITKG